MRRLQMVCAAVVVVLGVGCNDGDSTDGNGNDISLGDGDGEQGGGDQGGGDQGGGDQGPGQGPGDGDDDQDPADPATCAALCDALVACFPDGSVVVPSECPAECADNLTGCSPEGQDELLDCAALGCEGMLECLEASSCIGDGEDPDPATFCEAMCESILECDDTSSGDQAACVAECSPIESVCTPEELAPGLECASLDTCEARDACFQGLEEPPCLAGL